MKSFLLKVGILSALTVSLFNGTASAETASVNTSWSSNCSSFGEIKQNENPSFQHINCLLTNAALNADIPPEVVKAVASQESDWRQFVDGKPFVSTDGGIGIMQVTDQGYDTEKLANDITYNIEIGVSILNDKYNLKDQNNLLFLPKIKDANRQHIENWYFPVMAYNGIKPVNSPLFKDNGDSNTNAYQEKVFRIIEKQSYLDDTKLVKFPFTNADFDYDKNSTANIKFLKKEYVLSSKPHTSSYLFTSGEKVEVTKNGVNLRVGPGSPQIVTTLPINTPLIINGTFTYDESVGNRFVWFPVETVDQKLVGFISSAYITKMVGPIMPSISSVSDQSTKISGKTSAYTTVKLFINSKYQKSTTSTSTGTFAFAISKQKAGTKMYVIAEKAGNKSVSKSVTVLDKTAPAQAIVKKIRSKSTSIYGTAEKGATVQVYKGSTFVNKAIVRSDGNFTVKIKPMKKNTVLKIFVVDKASNKNSGRSVQVF